MPCGDGGISYETEQEQDGIIKSWCAILTVLEFKGTLGQVLSECDWKEAGVTKEEVLGWWAKHKRIDQERRESERRERLRKKVAKEALIKLSPEERKALGLHGRKF